MKLLLSAVAGLTAAVCLGAVLLWDDGSDAAIDRGLEAGAVAADRGSGEVASLPAPRSADQSSDSAQRTPQPAAVPEEFWVRLVEAPEERDSWSFSGEEAPPLEPPQEPRAIADALLLQAFDVQGEFRTDEQGYCKLWRHLERHTDLPRMPDGPPFGFTRVLARGFAPRDFVEYGEHPRREDALVVALARGAALELSLEEFDTLRRSAPVARIEVRALDLRGGSESRDPLLLPGMIWTAALDASGAAIFEDLPAGIPLHLLLSSGEELMQAYPAPLNLGPGERRPLVMSPRMQCPLAGRFLDAEGRALAWQPLRVWTKQHALLEHSSQHDESCFRSRRTDAEGNFDFGSLASGEYVLEWVAPEGGQSPSGLIVRPRPFEVGGLVSKLWIELRAERSLSIRGRVNGTALAGPGLKASFVAARHAHEHHSASAAIGADGSFEVGPLLEGEYHLRAQFMFGELGRAETSIAWKYSSSVSARAGEAALILELGSTHRIEGRLAYAARSLPAPATVFLTALVSTEWMDTATALPSGRFAFEGLPPGRYGICAVDDGGQVGVLTEIEVPQPEECIVPMERGVRVRIEAHLPLAGGGLLVYHRGVLVGQDDQLRSGGSLTPLVPVGELVARLSSAAGGPVTEHRREIRLRSGDGPRLGAGVETWVIWR